MRDYVNSAALQEYTTKLVAKLKTLFPGTPTAVATVAEMTDHNKTYVYVGTETGYTAGDWYYWDGSAWTSGGPFQATSIITDTTLAVAGEAADAKATGDAISAAKAAVLNAMAPAYSTSATYAVGDYVNYNGAIYRCTTAISTAEAWTAGHWAAVTLGADLEGQVSDLKIQLNNVIESCRIVGTGNTFANSDSTIKLIPGENYRIYVNEWDVTGIPSASGVWLARFGYTAGGETTYLSGVFTTQTLSDHYDIHIPENVVDPIFAAGGRVASGKTALLSIIDIDAKYNLDGLNKVNNIAGIATIRGNDATYVSDSTYFNLKPGSKYRVYINAWDVSNVPPTAYVTLAKFGYTNNDSIVAKVTVFCDQTLEEYYEFDVASDAVNPLFVMGGRAHYTTLARVTVVNVDYEKEIDEDLTGIHGELNTLDNNLDNTNEKFDNRTGNIGRSSFSVNAGANHSSDNDKVIIDIPANTPFIYGITDTVKNTPALAMIYATKKSDGTAVNILNIRPGLSIGPFWEITLDYDISAIGTFYQNTSAEKANVKFIVSQGRLEDEALYNTINDVLFVDALDSTMTKSILTKYADTDNGETFTFYSDPHYLLTNGNMTPERIRVIENNWLTQLQNKSDAIGASAVICGGDLINTESSDADLCYKLAMHKSICEKLFGEKYVLALGNHDTRFDSTDEDILDNMLYENTNTQKAYYSHKTPKTMFYVLNTGTDQVTTMNNYRWEQIAWLAEKLSADTEANRVIVMHIVSNDASGDPDNFGGAITPMATNVISLVNAYNARTTVELNGVTYDFSSDSGKVRCILCGHTHYDTVYTATGNLPIVCIDDGTSGGTVGKLTMDSCFIDYANGKLYAYRDENNVREVTLA